MRALIGFKTLVWREVYRFLSVFMQTVFPPIVSSFLYIFIFGYSIGSRIEHIQGLSYMTFLIPGLVMMYVIEGSYTNTSSSLFISRWANNIEELLVTPLSYFEMVLAILLGGLARSLVVAGCVYGVSLCFVQFPLAHPGVVFVFLIFVSLTFSSAGMIVALLAEEWEHLTILTTFVITPLVFLGGVFYSVEMMPEGIQFLTAFNPMFYMINGMRYGMLGVSDVGPGQCGAVVAGVFLFLFFLCVFLFKIGFKLRK